MRAILLSFACIFLVAHAADFAYMMRFQGQCSPIAIGAQCHAKGGSQTITSFVSSTDALDFAVKEIIGSYATWDSILNFEAGTTSGNFTFGTHLSRLHAFYYSGVIGEGPVPTFGVGFGNITSGVGQFDGLSGTMSFTIDTDADNINFTSYVTAVGSS
eukprot:TRINITY_DN106891_c0_g1_i1.p1 TRINITY_DN106891_c0_g1~~TRINITY_DN106891_c0_g1_i1.p1  ORF type:complete len:158 (+),score=39.40 TRINITY_DN106891_c0_g1_i1:34-507(+)